MSKLNELEMGFVPTPLETGGEPFSTYPEQPFEFSIEDKASFEQKAVLGDPRQRGSVSAAINCGTYKLFLALLSILEIRNN